MGRGAVNLLTASPTLASEWHPTLNSPKRPQDVAARAGYNAWWQCAKGHVWQNTVQKRVSGRGCPICSNRQLLPGYNDLATVSPTLASEWHPSLNGAVGPQDVFPNANKPYWWLDRYGHTWAATPNKRMAGKGCPYCSGRNALKGETDLATTHPAIAAQWHPIKNGSLTPQDVKAGSTAAKIWWQDVHGHEWATTVDSRTGQETGCPICAGQQVLPGFNDLATANPALSQQWHPTKNGDLTPAMIAPHSNKHAWWQDGHGHEWQASISSRFRGSGCPICANYLVVADVNDLASTHLTIAAQWHPTKNGELTAGEVHAGSNKKVWWQDAFGHSWQSSVLAAVNARGSCPICGNKQVLVGFNDLAKVAPTTAAEWHPTKNAPLTPQGLTVGSDQRVWWQCAKGHEWEAHTYSRQFSGCPVCARQATGSKGEQELATIVRQLTTEPIQLNSRGQLKRKNSELDIYIPSRELAIEYNGLYWHSEAAGKTPEYHHDKWQDCVNHGIDLLQVWEDDWCERRDIVIRHVAYRLGNLAGAQKLLPALPSYYFETIGARKCTITTLDYTAASAFLDLTHIQGSARGTHYLGLLDQTGQIRAVMVLKKTAKAGTLSLERYATAGNVAGGFTRLLSHAIASYKPTSIVTFAALDISQGNLYERSGFVAEAILPPDYSYFVGLRRVHKFRYRKQRFANDPKLSYDATMTERELAVANRLIRIWDAGKVRYVKHITSA